MKVGSIAKAVVLLVGASCAGAAEDAAPTLVECKAICKEVRQEVLRDIDSCVPALKLPPAPKLFSACVDGRKKGYEQTCVPTCAKAELSVSSYDGCLAIAKGKGQKYVDWCRKGYDDILQRLASLFESRTQLSDENPVSPKQEEVEYEQESEETVDSRELVQEELEKNEPKELESEPVKSESAEVEPAKSEPTKESEKERAKPVSGMTEEFQEGSMESKATESEAAGSEPDQSEPEVVESEMESANDEAAADGVVYFEQQRRASEVRAEDAGIRGGGASNKEL